jgi:4,5-DOPA dioxygenase extradiol
MEGVTKFPVLFTCHGGGPLPVLGDPNHEELVAGWMLNASHIQNNYGAPKAIAIISAHYETHYPSVGGAAAPAMIYDYGGFSPASYALQYPAPGAPDLAKRMAHALKDCGGALDPTRGFDHGVFAPLMLMFPGADIPIVPISVLLSHNAAEHINVGRALSEFRKEGVLFIGSGSTMHNFRLARSRERGKYGVLFNNALTKVLADPALPNEARIERMKDVCSFPGILESHPGGDYGHLMPLLTCVGLAQGSVAREVTNVALMGVNVREYLFE